MDNYSFSTMIDRSLTVIVERRQPTTNISCVVWSEGAKGFFLGTARIMCLYLCGPSAITMEDLGFANI